jgi:fumagillin biosynthesis dioxygenase
MKAISRVFHDPEGHRPVRVGEHVNPDLLHQVEEEGFCVLPSVIDRAAAASAREASVAAAEQAAAGGYPTTWEDLDPNGRNIRIPDLLAYDPVFTGLVMHEHVTSYVAALLGPDWVVSNFSGNIALPGSGSMNAHCDQSTIMPEPWLEQNCLNAIWCLDDVDEGNGATRYLPGSHRFTRFSEVPADPKAGMRPFEASAGSVIIMHGRMWHTSGENISADRERCLLFALYASGYLRLQANWWQIISQESLVEMSPDVQQRLGLSSPNRGYGAYLVSTAPQPKLGS